MENLTPVEVNVDAIVANIKKKALSNSGFLHTNGHIGKKWDVLWDYLLRLLRQISGKDFRYSYDLDELLQYEDEVFVKNLYRMLLSREADIEGLKVNLKHLRTYKMSKVEIAARILFSPEGDFQKVQVKGLILHLLINYLYKIPIIGYIFKVISIIIRLPEIVRKIQLFQVSMSNHLVAEYQPLQSINESEHELDQLYVDFENEFRGSEKEIYQRQQKYLNYIIEIKKNSDDLVLDLGCGRGEWLKILDNNKIKNVGVDSNLKMVKMCQGNKSTVVLDDIFSYLERSASESFLAITGFHVVEHIPFQSLVRLFDLCLDALKPGGLIIFETPNPKNLIVGACNFYTDPTHLNPIPPHTLRFLAKARGFVNVKVISSSKKDIKMVDPHFNEFYNQWINISPDYAIIATKSKI